MSILKRQTGEAPPNPSASIYPSHIVIAFLAGLLVGILLSIAAFYLKRKWMTRQRDANLRKLQIASRSSLILPQINSPSLLDAVNADVMQRRKSIFSLQQKSAIDRQNLENDIQIITMEEIPSHFGIDSLFIETDAVNESDQKQHSESTSKSPSYKLNDLSNQDLSKIISESKDELEAEIELESKISQTASLKEKLDQCDSGISLPNAIDTTKSIQIEKIKTSSAKSATKSIKSQQSSNHLSNSGSSEDDNSPLAMLLDSISPSSTESFSLPEISKDSRLGMLLDEHDSASYNEDSDYDSTFDLTRTYSSNSESLNSDLAGIQSQEIPGSRKSDSVENTTSNVLPNPIDTSQESIRIKALLSAKSGDSTKSSNPSSISQTDSPLGMLLKTDYKN